MIDLNCHTSCQDILFIDELNQPLVADLDGKWSVKSSFNGRLRTFEKEFETGDQITFPASKLPNESAILYVYLYKESLFVNKYKIKIYAQF